MQPFMRVRWVLVVVACLVTAGTGTGIGWAQSAMAQIVTDPHGRFAMAFPSSWQIATKPEGMVALLAAGPAEGGHGPRVNVVVEPLPGPMAPATYAAHAEQLVAVAFRGYTVIQQGDATIAGRPAYYRYFTWEPNNLPPLYQLQVYFTSAQLGFVLTGSTTNDPDSVRRDMPLIVQILSTFRVL